MKRKLNNNFIQGIGAERRYQCPFCQEQKYKMYVNIEKDVFNCFRCGKKGRVSYHFYVDSKKASSVPTVDAENHIFKLPQLIPLTRDCLYPDIFKYALSRVSEDVIYNYSFCYTYNEKAYKNRLIIPVKYANEIVYFQARAIYDWQEVKYLNPKKSHISKSKGQLVFNYDHPNLKDLCVITEGIFSSLAIPNNQGVATFGKNITKTQIDIISNIKSDKYIVMLDYDAYKQAVDIAEQLFFRGKNVYIAFLAFGDPEDNRENMDAILKKAISIDEEVIFQLRLMIASNGAL